MSSESSQRVFQLKLDPLTGNSEWVVIEEDDEKFEAFENSQQKHLLATTSYLDMLNDSCRNKAFRMAIEKTITKPCHVLDIGAGTGLLSMMAARAMNSCETTTSANSEGMVTACESYLPMVKLMRKVLHRNKMGSNINIINKRSDELKVGVDMPSRADVLVSEILDSELLGEGLIPTLQHAHDMLLVEDPLTVPYRATTYGQLVESTFLWKQHELYGNEAKALDSIRLVPHGLESVICTKSQQYAMHCDAISDEVKLLQERVNPLCLVADDSIFLALLVAQLSKTSHVIACFPGLRDMGAQYLRTISDANGVSEGGIEVCDKRTRYLTLDDTYQKKVDLFIGEPYYRGNDGMLPWQNLRFWKERSILDSVLSDDALIMPYKGILKARAMSLPDLWNSRRRLGEVEGFDHSVVNTTLGACGGLLSPHESPCLPYFIWQCGEIKELSDTFAVMEFDLSKPISQCCGKVQMEFTEAGTCHGFALWIDWVMDAKNSILLSTGPDQRCWKQGVKLLAKPVSVGTQRSRTAGDCCSAVVDASFDPSSGELTIGHAFS